jgi:hypothetical protein
MQIGRYEKLDENARFFRGWTAFVIEQFEVAGVRRVRVA